MITPPDQRTAAPVGRRGSRRGFVLPIVILLMLVVSAVAAVMLARGDAQTRTVARQLESYQAYHGVRGLRETIDAWMDGQQARSLEDVIDENGFVFSVLPGDGTRLDVYLFDAQGTLTTAESGINANTLLTLQAIHNDLVSRVGPDRAEDYERSVGPWPISVNTAARPLIESVVASIVASERADQLSDEIFQRFADGPIDREELSAAMSAAGVDASERAAINQTFTVQPTLWEFVVDVRGAGANASAGLLGRFRAVTIFRNTLNVSTSQYEQPAPFLSWESEAVDQRENGPPRPRNEINDRDDPRTGNGASGRNRVRSEVGA